MKTKFLFSLLCLSHMAIGQVTTESLSALASSFSIVTSASGSVPGGKTINLKLQPWPVDLKLDNVISGDVSLAWISKNVRFNNEQVEAVFGSTPFNVTGINAILSGGMPARAPLTGLNVGTESFTGVPGTLSQLRGGLPIKVTVPVKIEVEWFVTTKNVKVAETNYYALPADLKGPQLSIAFVPAFTELTLTPDVTPRFFDIHAKVTLTASGVTFSRELPKIPFAILPLPVPRVAVFFRHTNFDADDNGAALITVPHDSPIASVSSLNTVLNTLEQTLSGVSSLADIASLLLGINQLQTALSAQPHVKFKKANSNNNINNFNDITLIQRNLVSNDTEAEDQLSSMILIAPPGGLVRCFNARNRDTDEGAFELRTGPALVAIVKSLHSRTPGVTPSGSRLEILRASTESDRFGDELSSLDFM